MKKTKAVKKIAPSILSADFTRLGEEVEAVDKAGADWVHVDVMDGHFVPNITIGPMIVEAVRSCTKLPLDVHLMITNPEQYIEDFVAAGANIVTVHQEAVFHLHKVIGTIRELGVKAGVSINPATSVEGLIEILPDVDLVLVMTVNPGFGGQEFIDHCLAKIMKLDAIRKEMGLKFLIEADGGIGPKNAGAISKAGCDVFVAGSAIFKSKNYAETIKKIRKEI
ncbi:MAG: ribulose-phosphate 3-epimerase [Bacteriovoracia bacterium]